MVLRETADGLLCVRQADHAALCGDLAPLWGGERVPDLEPADAVVLAAARHDDGWRELDERPRFDPDAGAPFDYRTLPLADRLGVAERSVARVAAVDPYAGWLVSRHFASFHEGSDDADASAWVTAQVGRRAALLARSRPRVDAKALHPHALEANLDWLQLLDALSLAACQGWETWESRPTASAYGEARTVFRWRRAVDEPRAVEGRVSPWPFLPSRVEARAPARLLPGVRWDDAEALAAAWEAGREVELEVAWSAE